MPFPTLMSLPEDEYLMAIGQFAYMVAAIEGLLIFDLPRLQRHLPDGHTPRDYASLTTKQIGHKLGQMVEGIPDPEVAAYYRRGAQALLDASDARNAVLHARPATIDGRQRLYRWRPPAAFAVTAEWIMRQMDELSAASAELNGLRPAFPASGVSGGVERAAG